MDRLQSMRVFLQVVDEGGFAAAARKLDLAPAGVTRLVGDLEQHLGVRLLHRTTRRLALTQAGEAYLSRLRVILSEIDEAQAAVQAHSREMSGTLRILSPPAAAANVLGPALAGFQRLHPGVTIDVQVEDSPDPHVEDYDLTLQIEGVQLDPDAIVRTIIASQSVFCAAPDYLKRHGMPALPQDLLQHRCLRVRVPGVRLRPMTLIDPTDGDRTVEVDVPAVITANSRQTLLEATLHGAGIGTHPIELLAPWLKSGALQRVLAPWIAGRLRLIAVLPSRKFLPLRTRAFLDYLIEHTREAVSGLGLDAVHGDNGGGA
jgi:DNA-binding transcriptional LysR family regulator